MSIDRIDHPWGENGSLDTTLTDDKRDVGWISGDSPDQPTIERLNLLQNEVDNRINNIIDTGQSSGIDLDSYSIGVFGTDVSSHAAYDDSNIIVPTATLGGTNSDLVYSRIRGLNVVITIKGGGRLTIYDLDNMAFLEDVDDTTQLGLPANSLKTVCGDGIYVYIGYVITGSPDQYWVAAFDPSDWSTKTGWPVGGVQLATHQTAFSAEQFKVRMANSTQLFSTCPWRQINSGTDEAVTIIDSSDGTIDGTGAGDIASSPSNGQIYRACSNGEYVFMLIWDGTNVVVSSMSLSSYGATGCGWTWVPSSYPVSIATSEIGGIATCGETVVVTYQDGSNVFSKLTTVQGYTAHFTTGDTDSIEYLGNICTDGINFWAFGTRERASSTEDIAMIYRLDGVNFAGYYTTGASTTETISSAQNYVTGFRADDIYRSLSIPIDDIYIVSDGDSIWSNVYQAVSGRNTEICRIRRSMFR